MAHAAVPRLLLSVNIAIRLDLIRSGVNLILHGLEHLVDAVHGLIQAAFGSRGEEREEKKR